MKKARKGAAFDGNTAGETIGAEEREHQRGGGYVCIATERGCI